VQHLVEKYQTQVDAVLGQVICKTTVFLDGQNVRRRETNSGDWLADVVRQTAGADLAILNGGGIRTSLSAGPIRLREIHEIIPFENYIVALEMTGREVRQVLEHGLSCLPRAAPVSPRSPASSCVMNCQLHRAGACWRSPDRRPTFSKG
jgi:5'-nucleotidase / UDP-sugar diphosphatase